MSKENLETKTKKAIVNIDKKLTDMNNILRDMSMKLCHLIKRNREYYGFAEKRESYE
jgi:hypothetical protein